MSAHTKVRDRAAAATTGGEDGGGGGGRGSQTKATTTTTTTTESSTRAGMHLTFFRGSSCQEISMAGRSPVSASGSGSGSASGPPSGSASLATCRLHSPSPARPACPARPCTRG